jgi:broad specificity phosphatase PhoE
VKQYNQGSARTAHQKIALASLVAADLTRARRVAAARAEEIGIAPDQALRVDPDAENLMAASGQTLRNRPTTARGGVPQR